MYKIKIILISVILFMAIVGVISQRNLIKCEFLIPSGYIEISSEVLVSPSISDTQAKELLTIIESAKLRINNTFGNMDSSSKIIITATESEAIELGSNANGVTFLSPLGQCIVLGPKGQNIDVMAHEYAHAELHHRVGWLNYLLNVPTWFSEGVATLVDFRKKYLLENIDLTKSEVNSIKNQAFDHAEIRHYQAVRVLASSIDKSKFYENLEQVKQGHSINSVFAM